jgi:anthranilate synthase/aminodeoxychorismate synthase-like glutamine amidotransferase
MILVVDNYDSFVFNLARYIGELGYERRVVRNDAMTADEILALDPVAIVLSPGPCTPDEAGISIDLVKRAGMDVPLLGVCLGHQCIAKAYGGRVVRAERPVHGKATPIVHDGRGVFRALPNPLTVGRYHSLVAELPEGGPLVAVAHTEGAQRELMALVHRARPQVGVQFHPESILTEHGHALLKNFLDFAVGWRRSRDAMGEAAQ